MRTCDLIRVMLFDNCSIPEPGGGGDGDGLEKNEIEKCWLLEKKSS